MHTISGIIAVFTDHKMREKMTRGIGISLLALFTAACAACGGGGGGSPTSTANVLQPHAAKPVQIDAEGDSLIWGYQGVDASGKMIQSVNAPPVVLQATLQAQLGTGVTVANNAAPGSTVLNSINGTAPYYSLPLATRLSGVNAQIVIADYAANDAAKESLSDYMSGLNIWITTVRGMGKTPVLEEPNPSCDPAATNLAKFVEAMDSVAQAQGVLLIRQYQYILSLPNWQGMLVDCMHPNDALYKIKAQREAAALSTLVASLQ